MSASQVVKVVISGDDPRAHVAEFLNNLSEEQERAALAFFRSPEFAVFAVLREVEMDAELGEEWFA